jgi:hypothetical protein
MPSFLSVQEFIPCYQPMSPKTINIASTFNPSR